MRAHHVSQNQHAAAESTPYDLLKVKRPRVRFRQSAAACELACKSDPPTLFASVRFATEEEQVLLMETSMKTQKPAEIILAPTQTIKVTES
jgi:hypothetical protein